MMGGLRQPFEFMSPRRFDGGSETTVAVFAAVVWFSAILVRLSLPEISGWTLTEKLFEASSFVVFAAIPVFGLATPAGERFAVQILLPRQGLSFQKLLCGLMAGYIAFGRALKLSPQNFPWIGQLEHLVFDSFFLNGLLFIAGLFVALRLPFVMLSMRVSSQESFSKLNPHFQSWQMVGLLGLNALYLCLIHPLRSSPAGLSLEGLAVGTTYLLICAAMIWGRRCEAGLMPFDFGLMVLCAALIYWVSTPSFSFGVFIAVDAFILVLVYGTGLGRAHFGYSFQMRRSDWAVVAQTLAVALVVLIPLALASGFVQPQRAAVSAPKLLSYFGLFTLRVGLFEEIFFRAGIMTFLRDRLLKHGFSTSQVAWISALGCSALFGLVHVGNSAPDSALAPWLYRILYIGLATLASLFYALSFARSNRLTPAIIVHGFIDTAAVVLLGGFLAVPF